MQRRAAAISAVVFVLIGTASYALIATAERPAVTLEDPEYELAQGDQFQVGDRTYTVGSISASSSGEGGGVTREGQLNWTNQSARHTTTWENGTNGTLDGVQYRILVPNESDASSFTVERVPNRTAILQDDPAADNETVTRGGEEYVVITENGTARLVPAGEYFPEPERRQFDEGDQFEIRGNVTTVANVTNGSATLVWTAPRTNTVDLSNEGNVTLSGQQYLVFFPDNSTVQLESDYSAYQEQVDRTDRFLTHRNGLWGVTVLSGATAIVLIAVAFLPSRY